jgi:tRNA A-37 threonylcarbamoyl transferase component Bud32/Flp pilus assembly protein TadD
MNQGNRLERAVALHLQNETEGGDWQELLRAHADLADLLQGLRAESEAQAAAPAQFADYRLDGEIGRGGNGVVFAATDQRLGRRVAIKLLHAELAARPTTVARFLREGQMLARLDHPGIVKVHGVGEHAGQPWLAMEFLAGESLAARIERLRVGGGHSGDSLRQLVGIVAQVATAVAHAHRVGIVHRDVKPSNILLRDEASAVLTDFGIARDDDDPALTQTGVVVGSPHYMAPEQAFGKAAATDARVDVFSLGATLYECITLGRAFDGATAQAVLRAVLHEDPPDPRRRQRGVPGDLVAIAQKALEKDPAHRYATAAALADDLQAFLDLREVSARATTRLTRWFRRARRNPVLGATVALGALLVLVLGWLAMQWPTVAAARAAERDRAYDAATAAGFSQREGQAAWFERAIELDPDRPEAVIGIVMKRGEGAGPAAALAELERHLRPTSDPALRRSRAWLWRRLQRTDEATALEATLPPPRSSVDLWVRALQLMASPPTPAAVRVEALASLSLAVRTAPRASLPMQVAWAGLAVMAGDKEKRLEAAESLLAQWPDEPVALQVGGEALMPYDARRAIELLQRALDRGVADPRCAVSLGFACAIAGEKERSVEVLVRAFANEKLTPEPRTSVLLMLERLDAVALADELAKAWVERAPEVAEARRFAGRAQARQGDTDAALANFDHAVRLRPGDFELRLDRAAVLRQRNDVERLRTELLALAAAHPAEAKVHRALVDALRVHGPQDALLGELRRWAAAKPGDVAALRELAAELLAAAGSQHLEEAFDVAERADYLAQGKDDEALRLRAMATERRGDASEAERLRRRAAALAPAK